MPHLEITEMVLVHCNTVNKNINMIQDSCIQLFYTFTSPRDFIFLKTFNSEFSYVEV